MSKLDTISDILYVLRDGGYHTYEELSNKVEVSVSTIRRTIESLSYRHPIEIYRGQRADGKRGVQLEVFIDPALGGFTTIELATMLIGLLILSELINEHGKATCELIIKRIKSKWKNGEQIILTIKRVLEDIGLPINNIEKVIVHLSSF